MARSKRWTKKLDEKDILPGGGPEALIAAKKELGDFDDTHVAARVCRCENCAEERIVELATRFNKLRSASKGAPRVKHLIGNLENVSRKARQLAVALSELDDYSREWLFKPARPDIDQPELKELYLMAGGEELPPPSLVANGSGEFVKRLNALSEYSHHVSKWFDNWRLLNSPFPLTDRGGNSNMFTQWYGTPSENLVIGAYHIFEDFRSGEARKTEHGSFHRFVNEVSRFATGSRRGQSALYVQIKRLLGKNGALRPPKYNDPTV